MFLDQELKSIREAKTRLGVRCDLRRYLLHIEVRGVRRNVGRTFLNLTLGLAVADQILAFLRERKSGRRS